MRNPLLSFWYVRGYQVALAVLLVVLRASTALSTVSMEAGRAAAPAASSTQSDSSSGGPASDSAHTIVEPDANGVPGLARRARPASSARPRPGAAMTKGKPHIVFILADDLVSSPVRNDKFLFRGDVAPSE